MTLVTGIAVYFVVWWITLFMVLPWGNAPDAEVQEGNVASAPAKPRLWLKFVATTLLAGVFWTIIWFVVESGLLSVRDGLPT